MRLTHVVRAFEDLTQVTDVRSAARPRELPHRARRRDLDPRRAAGSSGCRRRRASERERDLLALPADRARRGPGAPSVGAQCRRVVRSPASASCRCKPAARCVVNVAEDRLVHGVPAEISERLARVGPHRGAWSPASSRWSSPALEEGDRRSLRRRISASTESARDRFIRAAYAPLDLMSFLTTGEDEVRAWPIRRRRPRAGRGEQDPQRHRARLHPRRGHRRRRPPRSSERGPLPGGREASGRRARTTSSRMATSSISASTSEPGSCLDPADRRSGRLVPSWALSPAIAGT